MKAVLLAGGFGTRISEESQFKPKPMIEIGGMPILWHIMKLYSYYGINEFIICAGFMVLEPKVLDYKVTHSLKSTACHCVKSRINNRDLPLFGPFVMYDYFIVLCKIKCYVRSMQK
jgi:choline kinase